MGKYSAKFLFSLIVIVIVILSSLLQTKAKAAPKTPIPKLDSKPQFPCKAPHNSYPFCNKSLSIPTRSQQLVSLLTLEEKISFLCNNFSGIPRLGIPPYQWWSESLHGIATNGPGISFNGPVKSATLFPQVLNSAASFNRSLWFDTATAIAVEGRAMYNSGQAGLTFWAPNVNIFRDPRWGRGQETPGEDPFLVSSYALEFVKGFQGEYWGEKREFGNKRVLEQDHDAGLLMLSACCKHFTAYDLEKWANFTRYSFNAVVTEQDMEDTYEPPFKSCVQQGKASCLMCPYNSINGVPGCAKGDLLQKVRKGWGFKGYIASDCDAVATIYEYQYYVKTPEDAVAEALKAGVDINCGTYMLYNTQSAIGQGKLKEGDIDQALNNLFPVLLRLGLFNGDPLNGMFGRLGGKDVCTKEHQRLALEAARQGIVLLKNDNFLPINKDHVSSLAIIGPGANSTSYLDLGGGYSGFPCNAKSYVEAFQPYIKKTNYAKGCLDVDCESNSMFDEAVHVAKVSDYVILVVGLDLTQETEDKDRVTLLLPGKQMDLVSLVASVSNKRIILVLTGGGPLDVSFAEGDSRVASILWTGYPGEAGGKALAEVIFGDYNPGGRLPMTWYLESFTQIPMNNMNMRADPSRLYPGRTHRFYTGEVVYEFGYGLSYTNYTYKLLSAPNKLKLIFKTSASLRKLYVREVGIGYVPTDELLSCDIVRFNVQLSVMNVGHMDGSHVVLLYSNAASNIEGAPRKQLIGFSRIHTTAHRSTDMSFSVDPCEHLSFANEHGQRILPLGEHILMIAKWGYTTQNFPFTVFFLFTSPFHLKVKAAPKTPTPNLNKPQFPCKLPHNSYPFCNKSLSIPTRSQQLVSLLTLEEKISFLCHNFTGIPRLGIPPYHWWSESLHGIATNWPSESVKLPTKSATVFPQVLNSAASFNRSLWFDTATAIAVEGRALYNAGQVGLTYWAPNVNIFRDPRWGRGQETPGEDPLVVSSYAVEFVKGFQGEYWREEGEFGEGYFGNKRVLEEDDGEGLLMLSACCKHFIAYDLEKWGNFSRYSFNAVVTEQDMEDTYEPPFKSCVEHGKASCLMCPYTSINGVPSCANGDLLQKVRKDWGFRGFIASDCDAVATIYEYQFYAKSPEDAVAEALKAGVDINCGTYMLYNTQSAFGQGNLKEGHIDRALKNLFPVLLRLGLFNGDPFSGMFGRLGSKDVCTKEHQRLALEAARQGIVLLKNDNNFLPLNKDHVSSLAIIGPGANSTSPFDQGGGYSGIPCNMQSYAEGFKTYIKKTTFASGCLDVACESNSMFNEALHVTEVSDYVILVVGLDLTQETEDVDRVTLLLPGKQMELVSLVASVSKKRIILVLTGGGPLDVSFSEADSHIASIIWVGYPGEAGGKALAEVIFGYYNPGGRLPMTWYPELFTKIPMNNMNMRADPSRLYPGRTHRFYTGEAVYEFGHGLSYTNYTYMFLSAPNKMILVSKASGSLRKLYETEVGIGYVPTDELLSCDALRFNVQLSVMNVGHMDGSHVVMLYSKASSYVEGAPRKQLIGFSRIHTTAHRSTDVSFLVDPCEHLSFANEHGKRILPVGKHILMSGELEHSLLINI